MPKISQAITADVSIVSEEPAVAATDATSRKRWDILPLGQNMPLGLSGEHELGLDEGAGLLGTEQDEPGQNEPYMSDPVSPVADA